jgi:alkylation response protein AidB-like acyl-CoA dehydrogenase
MSAVGEMRVAASVAEVMVLNAGEALDRTVAVQTAGGRTDAVTRLLEKVSIAVAEAEIASTQSSLAVSETMFTVSGASASLSTQNLDRHWRNT